MILIPRVLILQFRAVLRQSLMQSRSDWPLILCRAEEKRLTLEAQQNDVAVRFQHDTTNDPASIAFRASMLAEFEGRSDEPVTIEQVAFGKGRASWSDGGVPRVVEFETVTPESVRPFPETPKRFTAMPAHLLQALDGAARTTARESGRLALSRVQLRGRNGEVVATDGRQLLVQRGFPFPWSEDVLVPRVLAFGSREFAPGDEPIGVGRTESHIGLRVGGWSFLLAAAPAPLGNWSPGGSGQSGTSTIARHVGPGDRPSAG